MISTVPYKNNIEINLFNADRMGGLRHLRNLILLFSIYYSIIIILFIASWRTPLGLMPLESTFLVIFWIVGVAFFFWGWYTIRKLLLGRFEDEINQISELCRHKTQQLSDLITKDDPNENEEHLNQISNALDVLHKERDRLLEFGARPMDIKTILLFLGSSIPTLIAFIATLEDARKLEVIGFVNNNSQSIINQSINYFHYLHW